MAAARQLLGDVERDLLASADARVEQAEKHSHGCTGTGRTKILKRVSGRSFTLCYHAVSDTWDHPLAISNRALLRQLTGIMRRGWAPASVAETIDGRSRAFHVTFDDAFRNILGALPALEQLGIRLTVFACTDYAADGRALDVPPLDPTRNADRDALSTMRWEELRELAERGVEIASHTRTHPNLCALGDEELRRELTGSREEIEDVLGRRCSYLAYPYGRFDRRVQHAVEQAGYNAAFGLVGIGRAGGRFAIARIAPTRTEGSLRIAFKSTKAWQVIDRPLRRSRGSLARLTQGR